MIRVAHQTSWFVALILTAWLKILHLFKFMPFHPTSFLKPTTDVAFFRYVLLFFILYGAVFVLFVTILFIPIRSLFIIALLIGILISYALISWIEGGLVQNRGSIAKNIPFIVTILIAVRFVFETANFHHMASRRQKKLPYKTSSLK